MKRALKIFSTKPYTRVVFFFFKVLNMCFVEAKSCYFFCLNVFSKFGSFCFYFFFRTLCLRVLNGFLFDVSFIMSERWFVQIYQVLLRMLKGIRYAWLISFFLEGYYIHYFLTRLNRRRKRRGSRRRRGLGRQRSVVELRLGFFYNLLLLLPKNIHMYWQKRIFKLRGAFFSELMLIAFYIRMVRNVFPYKIKGIIYDNLLMKKTEFEKRQFGVKPGKKARK